jgi:hypothetical protein
VGLVRGQSTDASISAVMARYFSVTEVNNAD